MKKDDIIKYHKEEFVKFMDKRFGKDWMTAIGLKCEACGTAEVNMSKATIKIVVKTYRPNKFIRELKEYMKKECGDNWMMETLIEDDYKVKK